MKWKRHIEGLLALLLVVFLFAVICPVKLTIGNTHIQKVIKQTEADTDIIPPGCYHNQWDAPTGMNSSGEYWGVRAGNWVIQLDIWTGES